MHRSPRERAVATSWGKRGSWPWKRSVSAPWKSAPAASPTRSRSRSSAAARVSRTRSEGSSIISGGTASRPCSRRAVKSASSRSAWWPASASSAGGSIANTSGSPSISGSETVRSASRGR